MSVYQDLYRATTNMTMSGGSIVQNVYHFRHEGLVGVGDSVLLAAVGSFFSAQFAYYKGFCADEVNLVDCDVVRVDSVGAILADLGTVAINDLGTSVSVGGAPTLAAFVRMKTGNPNIEGSKYLGGLIAGAIVDGVFSPSITSAMTTWLGNYLAGFTASAVVFAFGVISTKLMGFVPFAGSGVVTNKPGHQRRRGFGEGE
jgi:hypothetical protein